MRSIPPRDDVTGHGGSERGGALRRELGVPGAVMMGLGSIVGTGVFVSVGIAAGAAGPAVVIAIVIAALLATCNALSSAQLAASHPVAGGTYEYGYRYLTPLLGFTAGWMFLCAKVASAATAALGFAAYLLHLLGAGEARLVVPIALAAVAALVAVVLAGIRRAGWANAAIVSVTLAALGLFVVAGLPEALEHGAARFTPLFAAAPGDALGAATDLLQASALMFVAYTGYGRIATLGEEVRDPRRTIPRAIVMTLWISALLYVAVSAVAVGTVGAGALAAAVESDAAVLETVAREFGRPGMAEVVAIGAVTAMLGVLLNLILGMSRVLLAMGRRSDMPAVVGRVNERGTTPTAAVVLVGVAVALLVSVGSIRATWSFSAFTVLIYYAITNVAALRLAPPDRLFARTWAWCGLAGCLLLAFHVDREIWLAGAGLIAAGILWHFLARRRKARG